MWRRNLLAILTVGLLGAHAAHADYNYEYYEGSWSVLPDFDALTPVATGTVADFDISVRLRDSQYGFRYTGTVTVAVADTYTFYTTSDDGSQLFIDTTLVVDNDGLHAPRTASGTISLSEGTYPITVTFFEQGGGEVLSVAWSSTSSGQQPIPADGVIGAPPDRAADGSWGPVIPWPHVAVSAANLPDGRVLTWSGSERATWPSTEQTYSGTWDPATGEFIEVFHDGHNMFCAHLAMAEDGRVFVNGGRNQTNSPWTSLFDYRNDSWEQIENMASGGRWYPTTIALTDGDMFTAIGTATNQRYPDRWNPDEGWRIQTGIDFNDMVLTDYFSSGSHGESRWWPLLHVAPNGKVFHSGPTPQMHWINPARNGSYEPVGGAFTDFYHKHGTTVMYDEGKLLTAGGWIAGNNTSSTNQAFTVDLNGPTPVVQATTPMLYPRKFQNGVILPTGEVLVVGGNTSGRKFSDDGAVMVPEVWDPETEIWRELAPMSIPRNYHSIALLLTDGTVLAAGSGYNSNSIPASTHQDGQVFSPPYLYDAAGNPAVRPAITNGAGIVETGSTFNVLTSEAIDYFSMIKMSSTTHGLNTDVRFLKPDFAASGTNSYDVTLHANPNVATPGYWMLFAVNAEGVPSEAHVVRITAVDTRYENLALSGTVSQSSDADGTSGASNAIDGDLSGHPGSNSLAATSSDAEAWWEIDLGQLYDIDTLRLWNRTDCCADELTDFHVFISADPFVSTSVAATLAQPGVVDVFNAGPAPRQLDLSGAATGRYVRVQRTTAGPLYLAEVQAFGELAPEPPPPPAVIKAENGVLDDVGSSWQTVTLSQSFANPVVIATPRYDASKLPAVTRVRNAAGDQFDVRVQNPSDVPLTGYGVDYVVVEAGVYDNGDVRMEAQTFVSTVTDEDGSWLAQSRGYQQSYTNPVVVGQVMSDNDPDWSVFWASNGVTSDPPNAASLYAGKHVAEDSDVTRAAETIGYLVIESGTGLIGDIAFEASVGADIIEGVTEAPAPYTYSLSNPFEVAVVSSAAMDGTNGGWPVRYDDPGLSDTTLGLGIDEDQILDSERVRTTDQVAYLAMERSITGLDVELVVTTPAPGGQDVTFTVNATGPGELTYSFNFGDGDTPFSTSNTASHAFDTPGRHTISVTVRDGDGNEETLTFTQLVHLPLTASAPTASSSITYHAARDEVWSVNPDNDLVSVIDANMDAIVASIPVPDEPRSVTVAPDGRVWVASKGAATLSVIDPAVGYSVAAMHFLPVGSQPHGVVVSGSAAYVALEATDEVMSVDVISGAELARATVGDRPRHLSLSASGNQLYASLFVTPTLPGEASDAPVVDDGSTLYGGVVKVLDPSTLGELSSITLQHSNRLVSEHSGPGVPNYLGPAVISPDGTSAWVPSKQDNILAGALRGGQGMTFDQTVRAISSRVDLATGLEDFVMRVDHDNASVASNAAFGPFGIHLFTALEGNREVAVSDVFSGVEILRFDVGRAPQGLAASPDGTRLYVQNFMDRSVSVVDVASLLHSGGVAATPIATLTTVASDALAPDVLLGKQLFYDSRDDRLAALDYMSCASCHSEGSDDGRIWDFTGVGEGLRNTVSLEGRAGMGHGFLHWSANFDEVQDFEAQIRNFAGGTGLMDDASFNTGTRSEPLGDPKAGISADLDALAAYISSLDATPASPFRALDGSLTADAQAGAVLFETEGCGSCHTISTLTDSSDGSGLHDVGTITADSGQRLGGPLTGIDTPTLLGVWATSPYLHDGSAATLEDAVAAHSGISLTTVELNQLGTLMRELEDGSELAPQTGVRLASGVLTGVGSGWQTVTLPETYNDMVVVATVQYDGSAAPAVARVRNASGDRFDVRVQNPGEAALSGYVVHYLAVEAGVYTEAEHGITMEAVKVSSSTVDRSGSWSGDPRGYQQAYASPIVLGQVMTANDARWSVFWASNGVRQNPPSPSSLSVGKHIGEDPDRSRSTETLGYVVVEAGAASVDGVSVLAGKTSDFVEGLLQNAPYATSVGGSWSSGVISAIAMDGGNGGWPILYGSSPLAGGQLDVAYDEDQLRDSERTHITEEVAYFLVE